MCDEMLSDALAEQPEFYIPDLPRDYSTADYAYEVIMDRVKEFEDTLDNDHFCLPPCTFL